MPGLSSETYGTGDQSWLGSTHGIYNCRTVSPDPELFPLAAYPDGVPSGTPLGEVTSSGLVGPYTGDSTDEVQTVTITGTPTGGTFTLTYSGQTTAAIAFNATAAAVKSALEALSNIEIGDVSVTGGPGPATPYVVTFGGTKANQDVAQMTASGASLTGGSTPAVNVTTGTAGGADASADGRQVLAGFLYTDQKAPGEAGWPMLDHGRIKVDKLPIPFARTGHNTVGQFTFIAEGA